MSPPAGRNIARHKTITILGQHRQGSYSTCTECFVGGGVNEHCYGLLLVDKICECSVCSFYHLCKTQCVLDFRLSRSDGQRWSKYQYYCCLLPQFLAFNAFGLSIVILPRPASTVTLRCSCAEIVLNIECRASANEQRWLFIRLCRLRKLARAITAMVSTVYHQMLVWALAANLAWSCCR